MASHTTLCAVQSPSPTPSTHFRFLDLPGELRNKIYECILCKIAPREETRAEPYGTRKDQLQLFEKRPPSNITYLRHSIETEILRTCRSVYHEGTHVLFQINRFVKITVKLPDDGLRHILNSIPILYTTKKRARLFKHPVIIQKISDSHPASLRSFIIVHRDLEPFCAGLMQYNVIIP
jgi:hypothetical protein